MSCKVVFFSRIIPRTTLSYEPFWRKRFADTVTNTHLCRNLKTFGVGGWVGGLGAMMQYVVRVNRTDKVIYTGSPQGFTDREIAP